MSFLFASKLNDLRHRVCRYIPVPEIVPVFTDGHYLGSRAVAGTFETQVLEALDQNGAPMREAMLAFGLDPENVHAAARSRTDLATYVEVHIEQGPVLENEGFAVGVVTAIAGATRLGVHYSGEAGHAGTVPMDLRRDALAAAAEAVLFIERRCQAPGLVGTVGRITASPGAVNVIPGEVEFSVDLRAGDDAARHQALDDVLLELQAIADARNISLTVTRTHDAGSTACDTDLSDQLARAVAAVGVPVRRLPSGAGHDAAAMSALVPAAMLLDFMCAFGA